MSICATTLLIIGLATGHPGDSNNEFNNDNHLVGVGCNNVSLLHFTNSFNKESVALSYSSRSNSSLMGIHYGTNITVSTGYFDIPVTPMVTGFIEVGPLRLSGYPRLGKGTVGMWHLSLQIEVR
jgi:hypothetical protein